MKLVWDLDGVLRDLAGHISSKHNCPYPKTWNETYKGKGFYECVDEDLTILLKAPPTAYLRVVLFHYQELEVWTNQPIRYQSTTLEWIKKHIIGELTIKYMSPEEKVKELKLHDDTILVEDNPNLSDYKSILLVDRPYNQGVKNVMRIYGPKHMNNLIELIKNH